MPLSMRWHSRVCERHITGRGSRRAAVDAGAVGSVRDVLSLQARCVGEADIQFASQLKLEHAAER